MKHSRERFFSKNGYFLAKNLFNKSDVSVLEKEFDKIVFQLKQSGEHINARWGGEVAKKTDLENSEVLHTHIMCSHFRRLCLIWFKIKPFWK